ncbi:MAG: Rieske (2Fe-2S) protein [Melioribacteraceae bacterium]|nr:Rieske (2Fe-2S) protein [Melioribacteraceae bacterium]MCF8353610.1 Rieske (2Fe-2S) protein [Melioribacteraceae bacterium]MCF8393533.1 Rieske (2Fe-2S) protein [Melioribacteraceae bacterium]MCF8419343.1 Rieske (2Fe-2S) protein [Melioribacteraceae bacterium]
MISISKISRRKFFKYLSRLMIIPAGWAWIELINRQQKLNALKQSVIITPDIAGGITFKGKVIVYKDKSSITFYSSKCTHLGCTINKMENGVIVCPCHGSKYDLNGNVIEGPAVNSLTKLDYKVDPKTGNYIVKPV